MEGYISPAYTVDAIADDSVVGWMPVDWLTVIANVMISVGMALATRRTG